MVDWERILDIFGWGSVFNRKCAKKWDLDGVIINSATREGGDVECQVSDDKCFHRVEFGNLRKQAVTVDLKRDTKRKCIEFKKNGWYEFTRQDAIDVPAQKHLPRSSSETPKKEDIEKHSIKIRVVDTKPGCEWIKTHVSYSASRTKRAKKEIEVDI